MPPKAKGAAKAAPEPQSTPDPPPETPNERSRQRFFQTNPVEKRRQEVGLAGLTANEKKTYTHTNLILPIAERKIPLSNKTEREFWKHVTKEGLPIRRLREGYSWGKDKSGRDVGDYKLAEFQQRSLKQAKLSALNILHHQFLVKREIAQQEGRSVSTQDIDEEKTRRKDMAALRRDLYGEVTGSLANDPEWDDVVPIPQNETEDALAQIAYPDDYAEAVSYLRAVMVSNETSPRSLRLTQHVISMNPAHYTVWLYRFKIIAALDLPVPDEIAWVNEVALNNLKNYQIWHHRQLLMDHYVPSIASDDEAVKKLAKSEINFISQILAEDTKNIHVWSYRQFLVEKLRLFTAAELGSTQNMVEDDVRNNSAWSHRFYLVFSDPAHSTPGSTPLTHDPKIPATIIDREVKYAQEKIALAPQNQSPWNYLRGVLIKGDRKLSSVKDTAAQYVANLGKEDEEVRSSHALDLLAEMYQEEGNTDDARLCLQRLADKWDAVREGYWKYRISQLK